MSLCTYPVHQNRREWFETKSKRANKRALNLMHSGNYGWYAVQVAPQKEFIAHRILSRRSIPAVLPLLSKWRRKNKYTRDKSLIAYPMVPRYLFVGFEGGKEDWFGLFSRHIIQGVAGIENRPVRIPADRLLEYFHKNGIEGAAPIEQRFMRTNHEFSVGDRVQIVQGPFDGQVVNVEEIRGMKARILLELFGDLRDIEIPLDFLEKDS